MTAAGVWMLVSLTAFRQGADRDSGWLTAAGVSAVACSIMLMIRWGLT